MDRTQIMKFDDEIKGVEAVKSVFFANTKAPNHNSECRINHPQVLFAFWQSDFRGGRIPYWHVMNDCKSKHSTLSMQGLREWGIFPSDEMCARCGRRPVKDVDGSCGECLVSEAEYRGER